MPIKELIRTLADQALDRLNPTLCELYAAEGRPSIPREQLLLAGKSNVHPALPSYRGHGLMDNRHTLIVTKGMVAEVRRICVKPHVGQNTSRPGGSAIDGRTSR